MTEFLFLVNYLFSEGETTGWSGDSLYKHCIDKKDIIVYCQVFKSNMYTRNVIINNVIKDNENK